MKRKAKLPFDPKVFLSKVNGGRTISDYRKDQIVYTQGDPADSVFYIQSGKVKNTVISEQEKEAVVAVLGTGDFFGEGCLTGQPLRLATVSAMTECVIVRITKADITRVIWSINCSIRARNGWPGSFCFWRILARKVGRSQS